ncbi:MAG: hypothetical protein QXF52_07285 [Thermoproteota archaeon]
MNTKHLSVFGAFMLSAILIISFSLSPLVNRQPSENDESSIRGIIPLEKVTEKLTLEQLISRLKEINASISLPTWMPESLKLTMIYYKPPVIVLVYSDRGVTDYRYANVTIEISLWYYSPPTKEELEGIASKSDIEVVNVKGIWVKIIKNTRKGFPELKPPYNTGTVADFIYSDKHSYLFGVLPPLATRDLIRIIESMQVIS